MSVISISIEQVFDLRKKWQDWHHSLHSLEITSLIEAGHNESAHTMDFRVDERFEQFLHETGFEFERAR